MATAMLADRGVRRKMAQEEARPKKAPKRKPPTPAPKSRAEQNNNVKRQRLSVDNKDDMLATYQPWVIQTYGDLAKTKTITLKKYARILRTLRGEEIVSADNSKFRFWVKAKGFHVGKPAGYEAKPADAIVGRYSVCDADEGIPAVNEKLAGSAKDPPLYVPNAPFKNSTGEPIYRKVAVVENFFDIIYNVHVELEGRPGKHAGQKRTYRTITETYAFLPREAVTRFLLGCTECQKHPRSPSPASVLPTPSPSPTLPLVHTPAPPLPTPPPAPPAEAPYRVPPAAESLDLSRSNGEVQKPESRTGTPEPKRSSNPLDVCNLTAKDPPKTPPKKRHLNGSEPKQTPPKLWSPVESIEREQQESRKRRVLMAGDIDYSLPITTTYLKYMRSLGCTDEDALKFENKHESLSTPESSEANEEDHFAGTGAMKDSDKLKLMLLAWNYHNQAQGNRNGDIPDLSSVPGGEEMAGLWAQYHSALGLAKGKATPPTTRDQSSPVNADTGSAHDETSSSGNKEDEDDDDDESDDKIDTQTHDPERLKAFNMFVRLFVDENLDRMVPISKQPKEKIQAIIDSCTRQFPEFAERARKRIRTYLKSCRRNKRARDPNSPWDATRPTPAHLTSVQAEQILATACENESHNAKRMRLGLEPVSQPMPILPGAQPTDTTAPINRGIDFSNNTPVKIEVDSVSTAFPSSTTPSSTPNSVSKLSLTPDLKTSAMSVSNALGATAMNGIGISSTAGSAPTAMYRPNFSQAFQRAGPYPLFPGANPFGTGTGLLTNGPADLSMKQKPLLNHKLSTGEMAAVRQLITGYRESAAFLLRSADELEQLLIQQQ
ncbi:nucleolar protein 4 isoform X1 [Tribolium castaneum]|nr:PREDICTED: nucleolar protein 4 isoform X1 [Tribolium castaneum]|eukprot:XP_008196033.1 PREDICTED: nucleolar protein 4 isoform X1 [Tribolium castaneum]